jgi:hypothetical protein
MRRARLAVALLAAVLAHPAAAEVPLGGELRAVTVCEAFSSIRSRANPGGVRIKAGTSYSVRGLNTAEGEWVHVVIEQASPRDRWVHRDCGTLSEGPGAGARPAGFRPFFDTRDDGPGDMTPPPPPLDAFDRAVLEVCGPWGSVPRAAAFRAMLDRPDLAADVDAIYTALGRGFGERRTGPDSFKAALTRIWFDQSGFEHIFCGEPGSGSLGGLHYRGRYLELQEKGQAGQMSRAECPQTEIEPPVYTFGVTYRLPGGRTASDCPKGYPADLNARDLLIEATLAYESTMDSSGQAMCLKEVTRTGADYFAVFVPKSGAIRTFYPDATPRCDSRSTPVRSCTCGR